MKRIYTSMVARIGLALAVTLMVAAGWMPRPLLAAAITCTVKATKLNLREAPSTSATIKAVLNRGESLTAQAQARNENRTWLRVTARGMTGWVDASLVQRCDPSTLPVETPTAPGTGNTPRPAATPARFTVSYAPAPNQGGADGSSVLIPREVRPDAEGVPVFRNWLIFKLDPTDYMNDSRPGSNIENVEFQIQDDTGQTVYTSSEGDAPYCLFSNATAECENIWTFAQTNYYWPQNGGQPIRPSGTPIDPNTVYRATVHANYVEGSGDNWQFRFRIIPPGIPAHQLYIVPATSYGLSDGFEGEIRIQSDTLVGNDAYAYFRDRMVFRMTVNNGSGQDGDGVGAVEFRIWDTESGETVYQHTEHSKPYCVFGNQKAYCETVWRIVDSGYQWPESDPDSGVPSGLPLLFDHPYAVDITVTDTDGNNVGGQEFEMQIVE